jgi:hypothetical protein
MSLKSALQSKLREYQIEWPHHGGSYFIPNDILETLINEFRIAQALQDIYTSMPEQRRQIYAAGVCDKAKHSKKIFAILLCGLHGTCSHHIQRFLDDGITDRDLPFYRVPLTGIIPSNPYNKPFKLCTVGHKTCVLPDHLSCGIGALFDWSQRDVGDLCESQWMVQAPTFVRSAGHEIPHLDLDRNVIMPFTEDQEFEDGKMKTGGFSDVWGVRIHYSHQNVYKPSGSKV